MARRSGYPRWFVVVAIVFFALLTVAVQEQAYGIFNIEHEQLKRHQEVLNDTARNPWNYRVLAEWLAEPVLRATTALGVPHPVTVAFLAVRAIQNLLIFAAAWCFYRACGLSEQRSLLGLVILSYSFTHVFWNSDLSMNTYFDVLFYLVAGWLIVTERYAWIIPLAIVAALNRETALFIPVMAAASLLFEDGRRRAGAARQAAIAATALCAFLVVFAALRLTLHKSAGVLTDWGYVPGPAMFVFNITDLKAIVGVPLTMSILPLLALVRFRSLPRFLQAWYLLIVPSWIAIHYVIAVANETRLFLVPVAVVLIPAALWPMETDAWRYEEA